VADFVTPAGRTEAAEIARLLGRALSDLDDACEAAVALLVSRDCLSPAAPQWREVSGLLAARPYLGDLRRLRKALEAVAGPGEDGTTAGEGNGND
jgi:hypothetical protein